MSNSFSPFAMLQNRVQPDSKLGVQADTKAAKPTVRKPGEASFADALAAPQKAPAPAPKQKVAPKTEVAGPKENLNDKLNRAAPKADAAIERPMNEMRKPDLSAKRIAKPVGESTVNDAVAQVNNGAAKVAGDVDNTVKSPLQQLADKARKIVGNSPVLSFLNGDYGRFEPETISNFITESGFLNTALEQTDLQGFMNSPKPLGQILADLQLSPEMIDQIKSLGLNMEELSSLRQVFEVLGMDPTKMADEIETLRTNLQLAGTSMYMRKAAKMRGQARAEATVAAAPVDVTKPTKPASDLSKIPVENSRQGGAKKDEPKDAQVVVGNTQNQPVVPTDSPAKPGATAKNAKQNIADTKSTKVVAKDVGANNFAAQDLGLTPVAPEAFAGDLNALQTPDIAPTKVEKPAAPTAPNAAPIAASPVIAAPVVAAPAGIDGVAQAQLTNVDPFAALGQKLDLAKTFSSNMQAPTVDTKAEAAPMFNFDMTNLPASNVASAAAQPAANASIMEMLSRSYLQNGPIAPLPTDVAPQAEQAVATQSYNTFDMGMNAAVEAGMQHNPVNKEVQQAKLEMQLERMALGLDAKNSGPAATLADQGTQSDLGQSGSGAKMFDQFSLNHTMNNGMQTKATGESSFAAQLAQPQAPSFAKPIVENATMMLTEGGGTVQLDLGSAELGELKVALNVKDQQLDVRILASSPAARDLLNQELPKLRESLAQQNMTLNHVQVGVGAENAQQQFSGFSRQDAQQFKDGVDFRTSARNVARSITPRMTYSPISRMQNRAIHSGQIQVSV